MAPETAPWTTDRSRERRKIDGHTAICVESGLSKGENETKIPNEGLVSVVRSLQGEPSGVPETFRILVVDDHPDVRLLVRIALRSDPTLHLDEADGGLAALAKIEERCPNLVILDLMMPDMDGFEVCRWVRSRPESSAVPILMLTALSDPRSRTQGVLAGASDFVVKPFRNEDLRSRVRTLLEHTEAAPTSIDRP